MHNYVPVPDGKYGYGTIYLGEMTFTSSGGMMDFYSDEFHNLCVDIIQLPR